MQTALTRIRCLARSFEAALVSAIPVTPEIATSPALSLMARPGNGGIRTRKVAILVANGAEGTSIAAIQQALLDAGAIGRLVGPRIGAFTTTSGETMDADCSMENEPGFLFDGLVLPDGQAAVDALAADGHTMEFIKDQYRHCKTLLVLGASSALLAQAGIEPTLPTGEADPGLIVSDTGAASVDAFIQALGKHRHPQRETDPPKV